MAWEEESIEGGADFEEVGGKKSPLKLIIIIAAVLIIGGGLYLAYTMFFKDKPVEEEAAAAAAGEEAEPKEELPADEPGFKVELEKFTVNLAGSESTHFMVATLVLEVTTAELKGELTDAEDSKLYMVKTRDTINYILRQKTMREINDPESTREIAKEILFKLNRIYRSGEVRNVYFMEILVQ